MYNIKKPLIDQLSFIHLRKAVEYQRNYLMKKI